MACELTFHSLVPAERRSLAAGRGAALSVSIVVHALLLVLALVVPLLVFDNALPATEGAVRAFFAAPPELAPAPPPPPPPAPAARPRAARAPVPVPAEAARLVAPLEVPEQMPAPDEGMDLGVEGGVPGGVEGGVPGGVAGGIIGGLPMAAPEPARPVVRIGGNIRAPKLVQEVRPDYPLLAVQARVQGIVILEAHVGTNGLVKSVRVLRSILLLDDAAIAAAQQRRYQPLLLNGVPTEFILTLTMNFQLAKLPSAS
jgi:protein TonB